jgi:hypothetical protein
LVQGGAKKCGTKASKREKKGIVKVFTKTNITDGVLNFICIRSAVTNENMFLKVIQLKEFSMSVWDKEYTSYSSFAK